MKIIKCYSELILLPTFQERFEYLKLSGKVCHETFGGHRYLNQVLYRSSEWKHSRREVIIRDNGFDLGHEDYPIQGNILVHHINPITIDDILDKKDYVFDPEYLISTSLNTHNCLHYGNDNESLIIKHFEERRKNDTCLWRR